MKIALVTNSVWNLINFRLNLAKAIKKNNYDVVMIAPPNKDYQKLISEGFRFTPLKMDNKGINPFKDIMMFMRLFKILQFEKPNFFLGFTIKPNIYGGFACSFLNIPSIINISGLGTVFIKNTLLTKIVCYLYKIGLRKASKIFFQNFDDFSLFKKLNLINLNKVEVLPGSGVDTNWFYPYNNNTNKTDNDRFYFLLSARILWDKGVGEYVNAARKLLNNNRKVEFQLLGFLDVDNRTAISKEIINQWEEEGIIRYLGNSDDVRSIISKADCVVLPSYREGIPKSLLEASSMCKPIITTDVPGCRDVVDDGITGLLCKPRDVDDLADKMLIMMELSKNQRKKMGELGREKMIQEFDEKIVINRYLKVIEELV